MRGEPSRQTPGSRNSALTSPRHVQVSDTTTGTSGRPQSRQAPGCGFGDDGVDRAHPRRVEPHRHQVHLAERAAPGLVFDDVRVHAGTCRRAAAAGALARAAAAPASPPSTAQQAESARDSAHQGHATLRLQQPLNLLQHHVRDIFLQIVPAGQRGGRPCVPCSFQMPSTS